MSIVKKFLTDSFDAVRKAVHPTPEERVEKNRQREINNLTRAIYGVIIEERELDPSVGYQFDSGFSLMHMPFVYKNLNAEEVTQRVETFSARLKTLGLSDDQVKSIVDGAQEYKANPPVIFPYML